MTYKSTLTDFERRRIRGEIHTNIEKAEAELRAAQIELLAELKAANVAVRDVWDLVNSAGQYPTAIPILVSHLDRPYPERVREGIARALAVRDARTTAWPTVMRLFREIPDPYATGFKGALAVALAAQASAADFDELVELLGDRGHGESRGFFISALLRIRRGEAIRVLGDFVDDPAIGAEVRHRLKRRKQKPQDQAK